MNTYNMEETDDIFARFPDQAAFNAYWEKTYVPLSYEDVREAYEACVETAEKHIFLSDYEEAGAVRRADFMENLSQDAQFRFQDALTEAFYEKNEELYETAFAIYEEAKLAENGKESVAETFHQEYGRLYREFLEQIFDKYFA